MGVDSVISDDSGSLASCAWSSLHGFYCFLVHHLLGQPFHVCCAGIHCISLARRIHQSSARIRSKPVAVSMQLR